MRSRGLLAFCQEPRTRKEVIEYLEISSAQYALRRYLDPLVESGAIRMTISGKAQKPKAAVCDGRGKRLSRLHRLPDMAQGRLW